jgi:hypothetical protein
VSAPLFVPRELTREDVELAARRYDQAVQELDVDTDHHVDEVHVDFAVRGGLDEVLHRALRESWS